MFRSVWHARDQESFPFWPGRISSARTPTESHATFGLWAGSVQRPDKLTSVPDNLTFDPNLGQISSGSGRISSHGWPDEVTMRRVSSSVSNIGGGRASSV